MSGNTFGKLFTVTSFGESHGPAIGCIVDGCPPGLALSEADLQRDLDRRRPGTSRHTTQRREPDQVQILSGVFEGLTTGAPIGLLIHNTDQRSKDYSDIKDTFRPGHADYTYHKKYGIRDYRGGGRSSARETAMRVAAGGIAKKWLRERYGVEIRGYLAQLGPIVLEPRDLDAVDGNPFFSPDPERVGELEAYITPEGFLSNHAGGILGGISTGQDITVSIALKPTSSLRLPGRSVDVAGNPVEVVTKGRHDPCVGIRATPIAEAMLAIVLMDHALRHRAQNADVEVPLADIPAHP